MVRDAGLARNGLNIMSPKNKNFSGISSGLASKHQELIGGEEPQKVD